MRAVVINGYGSKDVLVEQELPKPEIKANQVLVGFIQLLLIQLTGSSVRGT